MTLFLGFAILGIIGMVWILCGVTLECLKSRARSVRIEKVESSADEPPIVIDQYSLLRHKPPSELVG